MLQLPLATGQPATDFAQGIGARQLAEHHGHELAPTRETPRVPLGLVLFDCFLELTTREKFQYLREDAA
jgi:hypothetical protein